MKRRLGGAERLYGCSRREKNFLPKQGFEQFLGRVGHNLIALSTEISRLQLGQEAIHDPLASSLSYIYCPTLPDAQTLHYHTAHHLIIYYHLRLCLSTSALTIQLISYSSSCTEQNPNISLYNLSSSIPVTTAHYPSPYSFVTVSVTLPSSMNI